MTRSAAIAFLSICFGVPSVSQAYDREECRPNLAITRANFSAMQELYLTRKWTAVVTVDAARCAVTSGAFEIEFERLKENGPDTDFTQQFEWTLPSINVAVDFWADEAVGHYWINKIQPCPCAR
jgi:hypothetical protein